MAKKIIVRLWKDGVGRTLVANSQIITIDGLGSGPIAASDFADNSLTGQVNTSAQKGGFYKELRSPTWILTPVKYQVEAGSDIVLNWAVNVANTTSVLKWYAVNVGQKILYTGNGLVIKYSPGSIPANGLTGTFRVSTSPVDVDREVEITLWNGEFNIANELARSGKIRIIAKRLTVEMPTTVAFRVPIPLVIKGYPGEFVTYTGAAGSEAVGITGNVILDSTGTMSIGDIRGGRESTPGRYGYTFDGNLTADPVNKTVTITAEGYYLLSFASDPPLVVAAGNPLVVTLRGAPNENVFYNHPGITTSSFNNASLPTNLGSDQVEPIQLLSATQSSTLVVGSLATFVFNGSISTNRLTYNVRVEALKQFDVSGASTVTQNTPYSVTVTSKANDVVNWYSVKPTIDSAYLDYYPNARSAWAAALASSSVQPAQINTWIDNYHTETGSKLGYLSRTAIEIEFNRALSGTIPSVTDIGNGDGRIVEQITTGLLGRTSPYTFVFTSVDLKTSKTITVTVNKQFVMKVEGPDVVESGKQIPMTIYSLATDDTIKVFGTNLPGSGKLLPVMPGTGVLNVDLNTLLSGPLPAGDYTFNFDSARSDVVNAGGTLYTSHSLKVIAAQGLRVIGEEYTLPNQAYSIVIRSSVGDVITVTRDPITFTSSSDHAYFSLYPDVREAFRSQFIITSAVAYADRHYTEIGNKEGRVSPADAQKYLTNDLPPTATIQTDALTKPSSTTDYGEVTVPIGTYRYAMINPIVLQVRGRQQQVVHDFKVSFGDSIQVFGPQTSQVESVPISIKGKQDELVTVYKVTKGQDGIPVPVTNVDGTQQARRFRIVRSDGYLSTDLIGDGILPLSPGSDNRYYFFGDKSSGSAELSVVGADLVVQVGTALLYQGPLGSEAVLEDMLGGADLPTGSVWVMFKMLGGGGGGGGTDLESLSTLTPVVMSQNSAYNDASYTPSWAPGWLNIYGIWNVNVNTASFDRSYNFTIATAGSYTIRFMCDNGGSVYIDGNEVLVATTGSSVLKGYEKNINLTAGVHLIKLVGINTGGPGSLGCVITDTAGSIWFGTHALPIQTPRGRSGGRGGSAAALRGIVKITSTSTKKLVGAIGRGGGGGAGSSSGAAGGKGGSGFSLPYTTSSHGTGGDGGSAGGVGSSGGGGGGGGSTLLAVRLTSGQEIFVATAGGGGGGGGASWIPDNLSGPANHGGGGTPGSSLLPVYKEIYPQADGTYKAITTGTTQATVTLQSSGAAGQSATADGGGGGGSGQGYISSLDASGTAGVKTGVSGGEGGVDTIKDGGAGTSGTALINASLVWQAKEYLAGKVGTVSPNDYIGHRDFYGHGGTDQGGNGRNGAISVYWTNSISPPTDWGLLPEFPPVTAEGINAAPVGTPAINVTVNLPGSISLNGYWSSDGAYRDVYIKINPDGTMEWGKAGQITQTGFLWCKVDNRAAGNTLASLYRMRFTAVSGTFNFPSQPGWTFSFSSPSYPGWSTSIPNYGAGGDVLSVWTYSAPSSPGWTSSSTYSGVAARSEQGNAWRGSGVQGATLGAGVVGSFYNNTGLYYYCAGGDQNMYTPSYNGQAKLEIIDANNNVLKTCNISVSGKIRKP